MADNITQLIDVLIDLVGIDEDKTDEILNIAKTIKLTYTVTTQVAEDIAEIVASYKSDELPEAERVSKIISLQNKLDSYLKE